MMAATAENADVEMIWQELSQGITDVYAVREMNSERFMKLYTHVYNYCTRNPNGTDASGGGTRRAAGRATRNRSTPVPSTGNSNGIHSGFVGHELYQRIRELVKDYLTDLSKQARDKNGEELVSFYLNQWERFTFSSRVMNGFCSYLNRHWIRREYDEGNERVHQIYHLALDIWKDTFFEPIHAQAVATILKLINMERNGTMISTTSIKGMTESLVELGTDRNGFAPGQNQNRSDNLGIYQLRLEDPFIAETESFYARESSLFLQEGKPISDYMKKAEQRLKEERQRVNSYLHKSTMDRLMRSCETVLIEKQLASLHEEFPVLLKAQNIDDMARMYDLVSKLGDAFGNMRDILQAHIAAEGTLAVAQNRELCLNDPKEYIKTILDVYQKFNGLVNQSFKQDPGFVAALDRACGVFINKNELTNDPKSVHKTPEMLARYCDLLLKKSARNYGDQEMEELLNQAMTIFKYIDDKDVFQKYYSRMLANRLVGHTSASDDAEGSMISKLKTACGYEYTTKLQRMYQDIEVSKSTNEDFQAWTSRQSHIAEPMKVDFYIMILSSGSWPFTQDVNNSFLLPPVLEPCMTIFKQYYEEMHTGRKIDWLYSKSKGEVTTNCFAKKYTFVMSTYSIGILLQFNERDSYKLHELAAVTQLREDVLTQVVQSFLKANILTSSDAEDKLTPNSEIRLFKEYNNKRLKVNLMAPLKIDVKLEEDKVQTSIEQGRQHEVEAAIVRIMKSRKQLDHQILLSEVMRQVAGRFHPQIPFIKRCIDNLIEREYLKRKEGEQNIYEYVA